MNNDIIPDNEDSTEWRASGFYSDSKFEFIRELSEEESILQELLKTVRQAKTKVELERLALISEFAAQVDGTSVLEGNVLQTLPEELALQQNVEDTHTVNVNSFISTTSGDYKNVVQREEDNTRCTNISTEYRKVQTSQTLSSEKGPLQLSESADGKTDDTSSATHSKSLPKQKVYHEENLVRNVTVFTEGNDQKVLTSMVDGNNFDEILTDFSSGSDSDVVDGDLMECDVSP